MYKRMFYASLALVITLSFVACSIGGNNSLKSKLKDLGVDDAGTQGILEELDKEILAYASYNDARSNTTAAMKREGVSDADAEIIIGDITLDEGEKGVRRVYWYHWDMPGGGFCVKVVVIEANGTSWSYTTCSKGISASGIENFLLDEIGMEIEGEYISIVSEDLLDSLEHLARAAMDYNDARSNTIACIKEAGITDDAKIDEILNASDLPPQQVVQP